MSCASRDSQSDILLRYIVLSACNDAALAAMLLWAVSWAPAISSHTDTTQCGDAELVYSSLNEVKVSFPS
jgi:hypothetical protein